MDYEEKYKDALERAKKLYEQGTITESLSNVFPELRESEDEKISREITEFILTHRIDEPNDIEDTNSWLAWLEKQVPKPKWSDDDEQYLLICKNALRKYQVSDKWDAEIISKWLEDKLKQGEPKPKWSEEDEKRIERICNFVWKNRKGDTDEIYQQEQDVDWLKSLKQRIGG